MHLANCSALVLETIDGRSSRERWHLAVAPSTSGTNAKVNQLTFEVSNGLMSCERVSESNGHKNCKSSRQVRDARWMVVMMKPEASEVRSRGRVGTGLTAAPLKQAGRPPQLAAPHTARSSGSSPKHRSSSAALTRPRRHLSRSRKLPLRGRIPRQSGGPKPTDQTP